MGKIVTLDDLVGLVQEKELAQIAIKSSMMLKEPFPHLLTCAVGGLGKTTLLVAIANELQKLSVLRGCRGIYKKVIEAKAFNTERQLQEWIIASCEEARKLGLDPFLILDEIHQLQPTAMQEVLYYPLDYGYITTRDGDIQLPPLTICGATTRRDLLDENSFVNRFAEVWQLEPYAEPHIRQLVMAFFKDHQLEVLPSVVAGISKRSLGIPRNAKQLSKKIRRLVYARLFDKRGEKMATKDDMYRAFELLGIDELGLSRDQVRYLKTLQAANGKPVGISTLCGILQMDKEVVEGTIEPILLHLRFIANTRQGRMLSPEGRLHLISTEHLG